MAETNEIISGIPELPSVEVDPQTPQGTKLFSFNLFLNISEGSPALEIGENFTIMWSFYYDGNFHGDDPTSYYYLYHHYHYYQPQIGVKLPGMNTSTFINLTGPVQELFPVSNTEIEQCSWGGFTFIKVPVEIYLQSPYLYHLGTLFLHNYIRLQEKKQDYFQWVDSFGTEIFITTNAGKISTDYYTHTMYTLHYFLIMNYLQKSKDYESISKKTHMLTLLTGL